MTDNEIIKALECCISSSTSLACFNCPMAKNHECNGSNTNVNKLVVENALDLIKRQKAEIERLKTAYETLKQEYDSMFSANRNLMAEIDRLKEIVEGYAASARIISLYLKEFCNKHLPYDEMIAEASKKAEAEIERLRNEIGSLNKAYPCQVKMNDFCLVYARSLDDYDNLIGDISTEGIKEFAEKVYRFLCNAKNWRILKVSWLINSECDWLKSSINNLVKEMTEKNDFKEELK